LNWRSPQSSALAASLDNLSSLGLRAGLHAPNGEVSWLRHAGLLGGAPRSMSGLLALLADRFEQKAEGRQFCGKWRYLEPHDVHSIGAAPSGPRLGRNALLGGRVWDQSAGISVEFADITQRKLIKMLPVGEECALLSWTIRRYMQSEVDVEIALRPKKSELNQTAIGSSDSPRLGWTSWLGAMRASPSRFNLKERAAKP